MVRRRRRNSKWSPMGLAMTVVLAGSAVAMILPRSWTDKLFHFTPVLVPMQDAASSVLGSVEKRLSPGGGSVSRAELDAAVRRESAMAHRTAALALRAAELERQVELLTATRRRSVEGGRIGASGRLVPARVLSDDLLGWRASKLVAAGSVRGVREGAAVTSDHFAVHTGDVQGLHPGLAIVLGEVYIGVVDKVSLYTSCVRLLSDPATEMKVRIGRSSDDGFRVVERYFWLVGRGGGRMEIRDVEAREVDDGEVAMGDWVLSDPLDPQLPSAMVIGRVSRIKRDEKNPLFGVVEVESAARLSDLVRVYVYDPSESPADSPP